MLSPLFYINDLLYQLEPSAVGIQINSVYCGCQLMIDVYLVASSPSDLQTQLNNYCSLI